MKKIGLKHPVCATYSEITGAAVYAPGIVIGKAMNVAIAWTKNNVKLYADDSVDETDQSITGGTITLGVNELLYPAQAYILGHEINSDGELVVNESDIAPYVGFGFYGKVRRNGVDKYRAVWLKKVQFSEPNDDTNTKGENVAFSTPSVAGEIMKDIGGNFKTEKLFDTEEQAIAWLDTKANVQPICKTPVASVPSGTYSTEQSVTLTAGAGESIYYTTNGMTPSATTGTLYSTAIVVEDDTALRAIAIKSGSANSEIAEYEYIITG